MSRLIYTHICNIKIKKKKKKKFGGSWSHPSAIDHKVLSLNSPTPTSKIKNKKNKKNKKNSEPKARSNILQNH